MLSDREIEQYLARIRFSAGTALEPATLQALHKAHMLSIPFENLDIPLGREITLSIDLLFEKIVLRRRGGFCYELNYLFFALLSSLGFNVQMLSAMVYNGSALGKEFDHMLLLVEVQGEQMIADVGFGDSFVEPLRLNAQSVTQGDARYRIESQNGNYVLFQTQRNAGHQAQYQFSLTAYDVDEFREMCTYQQTSPESPFCKKSVCSIATEDGRTTISNGRFITTVKGVRAEHLIQSESEYRQILQQNFHMSLSPDIRLDKLLAAR